jgi:peptidoglycan hydrolase CwlO-like protein
MTKNGTVKWVFGILGVLIAAGIIAVIAGTTASKVNDAVLIEDIKHIEEEVGECKDSRKLQTQFNKEVTENTHTSQQSISNINIELSYMSGDILEQKEIDKEQTAELKEANKKIEEVKDSVVEQKAIMTEILEEVRK